MSRILVIDDSKITQMLVAEILAGKYELDFRDDGLSGIEAVKQNPPDLILLDIRLPNMDGFEVCRTLKKDEATADIPVIFITSMESESERVKGFEAGAEDYVVKPFYLEELLARIKVQLALQSAKSQAVELERLKVFKELAVALSHEINNPLTIAYAYLHLLRKELPDAKESISESLSGIHKEMERIREITDRLANASKVVTTNYNGTTPMIDIDKL